jgi:hypothetical protein
VADNMWVGICHREDGEGGERDNSCEKKLKNLRGSPIWGGPYLFSKRENLFLIYKLIRTFIS